MSKQMTVKRPLFVFCMVFFAVGILTAGASFKSKLLLIPAGAALFIISYLAERISGLRRLALYTALLLVLPALLSCAHQALTAERRIAQCGSLDKVTLPVTVTVEEVRYSSSYFGYYTARVKGSGKVHGMTVSLGFPDGSCEAGDVLSGEVTFRTLDGSTSFDEETYFIPDGILMCAEAEKLSYVGKDTDITFSSFFRSLNRRLTSRIRAHCEGGELACAVLLGSRDLLDASVKRDFGRVGISHLLAVSGIHLSVAVAALELLLKKLKLRGRPKVLLLCISVVFSMALVGFTKSIVRAGAMHLIRYTGALLGRRTDALTNLGFAAVIIILADPFSVYDTGFILSVLACFSCIVYSRCVKDRAPAKGRLRRALRGAFDTVKLTLLITGLTLPVAWKVFGCISLISPLTNVVFIPAVTVFMYFSLFYLFLCGIPVLNAIFAPVLVFSEGLITSFARELSLIENIEISLHGTAVGVTCALLFLSLLVSSFIYKTHKAVCALSVGICTASLALCIIAGQASAAGSAEAAFVTRGKSEGFCVRYGTEYVIVDVSDGSSGFSRELTFTAEELGSTEISALILTHLHRRQLSSVTAIADNRILRRVMLPSPVTNDDADVAEALCALLDKRGVPYTVYSREDSVFSVGGVTFASEGYTMLSRSTHPVVAFTLRVGTKEYLYLGSSCGEKRPLPESIGYADTVFLGAHPPVRKLPVTVKTEGSAVLSYSANEKDCLTVDAAKGKLTLLEDETYYTGKYKKQ